MCAPRSSVCPNWVSRRRTLSDRSASAVDSVTAERDLGRAAMPPEDRDRLSTALERLLRTSVCFLYRTCVLHSSESIELRARHGAVPVFSAPRLPQPHHSPELDAPAWTVGPSGPSEQAPFSDASLYYFKRLRLPRRDRCTARFRHITIPFAGVPLHVGVDICWRDTICGDDGDACTSLSDGTHLTSGARSSQRAIGCVHLDRLFARTGFRDVGLCPTGARALWTA